MNPQSMEAPLGGIRVLDFTHAAAGPYTTMWLADLGAEVIKVEKPGRGDGSRHMGEPLDGTPNSDYFASLNRNKRDILLNLQVKAGVELAARIAATSHVVVQNFRPGVMDRLGLGFKQLAPVRPGLVYCSISAFGASGPWRDRPANDIIMQGVTGLMDMTGEPDGEPVRVGTPVCDFATGLFALAGVLAALNARANHPEGQHVEVNMFDSTIALMANYVPAILTLGRSPSRQGRGHAQLVPYQAFRCQDDRYIIVGAFTDAFWRRLCSAIGRETLVDDPRFLTNADRIAHREVLVPELEEVFRRRPQVEWLSVLESADVPCTPVHTLAEALTSEQSSSNGTVVELPATNPQLFTVGLPARSRQWPQPERRKPPSMGADTAEVLEKVLGVTASELDRLSAEGAIGTGE